MKLKLNNSEMLALCSLVCDTVKKYEQVLGHMHADNKKSALIPFGKGKQIDDVDVLEVMREKAIFEEMWVKFQKKSFQRQDKYTLKLEPHQAITIHLEFNGVLDVTTYTGNLIQQLCNKIHQQYQTI
jgi:hypothetical protein